MKYFVLKTICIVLLPLLLVGCNNSTQVVDAQKKDKQVSDTTVVRKGTKIPIFQNIEKLTTELSKNGIGNLKKWSSDGIGGYDSITDYFSFGSPKNGMRNNLAYYIESDNPNFVKVLKLVLNINNQAEKKECLSKLENVTEKTFKSLSLDVPKGLSSAIKSGTVFNVENDFSIISLRLDESKIDTWTLRIETK
jgi:hypothetical protein